MGHYFTIQSGQARRLRRGSAQDARLQLTLTAVAPGTEASMRASFWAQLTAHQKKESPCGRPIPSVLTRIMLVVIQTVRVRALAHPLQLQVGPSSGDFGFVVFLYRRARAQLACARAASRLQAQSPESYLKEIPRRTR